MQFMSSNWFDARSRRSVGTLPTARATAWRWAGLYAGLAGLWILLSDGLVSAFVSDPALMARVQQIKGLCFVALTGLLVYLAVLRTARTLQAQQRLLQRRHAEISVVESRWRHLMTNLEEVAWFANLDGQQVRYVSAAAERVYGRAAQDFLADPALWLSLVHPDDLPMVHESLRKMHADSRRQIEYRVRHIDGSWRWVRDRASVLHDSAGEAVGIGGIVEDITERRLAQSALRQRELQLADIVNTAMDAIISVDAQHRVVLFNRAAEKMFGIEARSAIGHPIERFIPMALQAASNGPNPAGAQVESITDRIGGLHDLRGQRADGEVFPFEASMSTLDTEQGPRMTVLMRDMSEVRAAQAAREAQATAEAASRAKTDFLSRMSHELRTPLNAVLGFSQLLQTTEDEPLSERQRSQVEHIHQAGWHLLALINDVLDVSRIEAGQLQVQNDRVALAPLVAEVLRMCESQAEHLGVVLHPLPAGAPALQVRGDRTRLRQVLLNLLSNGIKYNRRGGEVRVRLFRERGFIGIEVIDNGIGMSRQQTQHLFEPFNRLGRERGSIEGTGIGLLLTRELVHLMNGRISLDSEQGHGTRVQVCLPDVEPADDNLRSPVPTPPPEAEPVTEPGAMVGGLVLYIEDNPVNALVVQELVTQWSGVRLVTAEDGTSGIAQARKLQPDLVLLDMRLPDMDGTAVLHTLRADPATRDLWVVALSASAMPEDVAAAVAAGALEYWTKPLDFKRFVSDMRRLLAARRSESCRV